MAIGMRQDRSSDIIAAADLFLQNRRLREEQANRQRELDLAAQRYADLKEIAEAEQAYRQASLEQVRDLAIQGLLENELRKQQTQYDTLVNEALKLSLSPPEVKTSDALNALKQGEVTIAQMGEYTKQEIGNLMNANSELSQKIAERGQLILSIPGIFDEYRIFNKTGSPLTMDETEILGMQDKYKYSDEDYRYVRSALGDLNRASLKEDLAQRVSESNISANEAARESSLAQKRLAVISAGIASGEQGNKRDRANAISQRDDLRNMLEDYNINVRDIDGLTSFQLPSDATNRAVNIDYVTQGFANKVLEYKVKFDKAGGAAPSELLGSAIDKYKNSLSSSSPQLRQSAANELLWAFINYGGADYLSRIAGSDYQTQAGVLSGIGGKLGTIYGVQIPSLTSLSDKEKSKENGKPSMKKGIASKLRREFLPNKEERKENLKQIKENWKHTGKFFYDIGQSFVRPWEITIP